MGGLSERWRKRRGGPAVREVGGGWLAWVAYGWLGVEGHDSGTVVVVRHVLRKGKERRWLKGGASPKLKNCKFNSKLNLSEFAPKQTSRSPKIWIKIFG
jgi:hypothetical protein